MRMRASFRQFGDIMCAAFGLRRTGTPLSQAGASQPRRRRSCRSQPVVRSQRHNVIAISLIFEAARSACRPGAPRDVVPTNRLQVDELDTLRRRVGRAAGCMFFLKPSRTR